ncbi:xaa-Pro dipeptidase [Halyomorpha halys]|uniref:xaa-Pro dipeptidase n=1 Tax=Halyomorpha halys TaxID=286706 RepID=UPI0006D4DA2B|nr:xaa-Pro dipeptidase [Halyomorpha halys]
MDFVDLMNSIPKEYSQKRRKSIEALLAGLDMSMTDLKIKFNINEISYILFKENRNRLVAKLRNKYPNSMVLLKGNELIEILEYGACFQLQDSYFYWTFGVKKPNLWGAIDVETGTSYILYNTNQNEGPCPSEIATRFEKKYKIDKLLSFHEFNREMTRLNKNIFLVLSNMGEETISDISRYRIVKCLPRCGGAWMCNTDLTQIINECRAIKSKREQVIMTVAARLNSKAVELVMRDTKPGMAVDSAEALFSLYIKSIDNNLFKARPPSCLVGQRIFCEDQDSLPFNLRTHLESGELCIFDMGVTMRNYRTNLIATIPVNGIFSDPQGVIYNIVLEIRKTILEELKPGITFAQLANISQRTMAKQMILNFHLEATVDDILETGICAALNPNGIGHFLGIDFYDSEEEAETNPTKYKRGNIGHIVAKEGMILALNSELYLNEVIIKEWMNSSTGHYLQSHWLLNYLGLAARIQDVVLITSYSTELLSNLARTIKEIENTMSQGMNVGYKVSRKKQRLSKNEIKEQSVPYFPGIFFTSNLHQANQQTFMKKLLNRQKDKMKKKTNKFANCLMEEGHTYPYEPANMFDLLKIPLYSEGKPYFIPFPAVSSITKAKLKFPKQGYGCPYFNWNEASKSYSKLRLVEYCLDIKGIKEVNLL